MAVRNMVRELSYGQSGVSRAPINKEWKYGALMQALFDAEREEDYRASDHVSITDHEHT